MNYGGWWFGGLLMFIFWIFVIILIVYLVKSFRRGDFDKNKDDALNILKERYAKGEINKEEYEEKKKDVMK